MGIGFVFSVILLAVVLGLFARQALANVDDKTDRNKPEPPLEDMDNNNRPHAS